MNKGADYLLRLKDEKRKAFKRARTLAQGSPLSYFR